VVDIEAMQHHVEHHRIVVLLDERRDLRFELKGARAAQEIVHLPGAVLKGELDVVEAGALQRLQARLIEADPGGDEIDVETELMRSRNDRLHVIAHQRLAAGEPELHSSRGARLAQHPQPLSGGEFRAVREKSTGL
jgi:hypothetical protein